MRCSIAARLAREIGGFLHTRPAKIGWAGGVVSFSFDDFPKSAWLTGGPILEKCDLRATYYTALSFAGTIGSLGPMFDLDDLRAADANGHEIACHTYSHADCVYLSAGEIVAETERNAAALAEVLDGTAMTNFAYPFGAVSLAAKAALSGRFASCRGTGEGINRGTVDLTDLRAVPLYPGSYDRDRLCRLIDENRAVGGWLIFFTHDVADQPSAFGCTPEQLDAIVAYAAETSPVLPVRDVLAGLGLAGERAVPQRRAA
jgi:peptidoglycan/xylan/chitin deacetylase (PgdA/CDA1 family)